jgi:hypothetical protein
MTLIWEWHWGVGRSLLAAIGSPHESGKISQTSEAAE